MWMLTTNMPAWLTHMWTGRGTGRSAIRKHRTTIYSLNLRGGIGLSQLFLAFFDSYTFLFASKLWIFALVVLERFLLLSLGKRWSFLRINDPHTTLGFRVVFWDTRDLEERLVE
jgi:hypothetical protein